MKAISIPNFNVGYYPSRITHIFLVCSTNIDREPVAVLVPRLKRKEDNNKKSPLSANWPIGLASAGRRSAVKLLPIG